MENRYSKHADKRIDSRRDGGDNIKRVNKNKLPILKDENFMADRGDSGPETHTDKVISKNVKNNDAIAKYDSDINKRNIQSVRKVNPQLDIDKKKRIREKYTIKIRNKRNDTKNNLKRSQIEVANDNPKKRANDAQNKEKYQYTKFESTKTDKDSESKEKSRRLPVIRTVIAKNDATKVYKAVTFTEQKKKSTTPLQINIPMDVLTRRTKLPKTPYDSESIVNVQGKINRNERKKRQNYRTLSPVSVVEENCSPPTEVAKWAPSNMNTHAKPYYEAWVNTTLAAISNNAKKNKPILDKQNIIRTFKKFLEQRPESPELVYENYMDERYTGKIKINHRY